MAYATQHNGGKYVLNPNFSGDDDYYAHRTINIIKTAQTPTYSNDWLSPADMDANGYPTSTAFTGGNAAKGAVVVLNFVALQSVRPGNYVVKWDGYAYITCSVNFGGSVSGLDTTTSGGLNNRIVVVPGPTDNGRVNLSINNVGSGGMSNLRMCHADDEALMDAGVVWSPVWEALVDKVKPGVFRFMNWMFGNDSNMVNWNLRIPQNYMSWNENVNISRFIGTTTNSGNEFSINPGKGALTHGEQWHMHFNANNSALDMRCSLSHANPCVVTRKDGAAHGLSAGDPIAIFDHSFVPRQVSISKANPAVITMLDGNVHQLVAGDTIQLFHINGETDSPNISTGTTYYVLATGLTTTSFRFSTTPGGTAFNNSTDTVSTKMQCNFTTGESSNPNIVQQTVYYVLATGLTSTSFQFSITPGGTAFNNSSDTSSTAMDVTRQVRLNRDSTGAKILRGEYGNLLRADTHGPSGGGSRKYNSIIWYDAGVDCWLYQGNGRYDMGFPGDAYCRGFQIPLEYMLDLCARHGMHPMFAAFDAATYPSTGIHKSLAQFCKDWIAANGVSWMKVYMEGPNETWNWPKFGLYQTQRYISRYQAKHNTTAIDYHNPYGWAMTELGQEWQAIFSSDTTKYAVICGVQAGGSTTNSNPRLDSDEWMAQGTPPAGYSLQPAKNYCTHITIAQYTSSPLVGNSTEQTMQANYTAGDTSQLGLYLDTYDDGSNSPFNLTWGKNVHTAWKAWALSKGVANFMGYEGGYSPDYGPSDATYTLRRDAKQYTGPTPNFPGGIYHILQKNYDNFMSLNGGGMTMEFPAIFDLEGRNPSIDAWAIQEDINQPYSEQVKCYSLISNGKRRYVVKTH